MTRSLGTPLLVADAVIANLGGDQPPELGVLLGHLRDRGEHVLRGRAGPIRIWSKGEIILL